MSETLYVTPAQVLAAKLSLELSEEAGEAPDEAIKAIANAQVVARQQSTPGHETSADPTPATVHPQIARTHIFNRGQDDVNPEQAGSPRPRPPTRPPIGAGADEPVVSRFVDPEGRSDEETDWILAEDEIKHPERYGTEQGQQGEGRGPDERGSGRSGR